MKESIRKILPAADIFQIIKTPVYMQLACPYFLKGTTSWLMQKANTRVNTCLQDEKNERNGYTII